MNKDLHIRNRLFIGLAFALIALITFYPVFFTGFATADDLQYYILSQTGNIWKEAAAYARDNGRFYYHLVKPVHGLPYMSDNAFIIKLYQLIPILACYLLFAKIIAHQFRSATLAGLLLLLLLMNSQFSGHTSLFVVYPFYFTFSLSLLLLSFLFLRIHFETGRTMTLVISVMLFAAGLLFYEVHILYLVFLPAAVPGSGFNRYFSPDAKAGKPWARLAPFVVIGLVYAAGYLLYQSYHPTAYTGNRLAGTGPGFSSFLSVIRELAGASFPLSVFSGNQALFSSGSVQVDGYSPSFFHILAHARVEWIVRGILVSVCGYYLLKNIPKIPVPGFPAAIGISLVLIVLPQVPLALTEKYTFYVTQGGMKGYVTTFYSMFGTMLFLVLVLSRIINRLYFSTILRGLAIWILVAGFFICSVLTGFSNDAVARDIRSANLRFTAMDELMATEPFRKIPSGAIVFARDMYENPFYSAGGLTEQNFNWSDYIMARTGRTPGVFRDEKKFLDHAKSEPVSCWYLTMRQALKSEEIFLLLAELNPVAKEDTALRLTADKAYILVHAPADKITVSMKTARGDTSCVIPIRIERLNDTIRPANSIRLTVKKQDRSSPFAFFSLEAAGLDLTSVMIY